MSDSKRTKGATGPTSVKGKKQVSKNALTHGLTARKWLVLPEERPDFEEFRDAIIEALAPHGPVAEMLAARVVRAAWRLRKAYDAEAALWAEARNGADTANATTAASQSYTALQLEIALVWRVIDLCERWLNEIGKLKRPPRKVSGYRLELAEKLLKALDQIWKHLRKVRGLKDLNLGGVPSAWEVGLPHFVTDIVAGVLMGEHCMKNGRALTRIFSELAEAGRKRLGELSTVTGKLQEAGELEVEAPTPDSEKLALLQRYVTSAERGLDRALKAYREFVSQKREAKDLDPSG